MPHLSWNEVRDRAIRFSRDHAGDRSESAQKQTFWNEFFEVFGKKRRTLFVRVKRTSSYLPSMNSFGKRPPC